MGGLLKEYQGHAVGEIEVGIAASSRQQSVVRETAALESGVLKTEQPALLPRLERKARASLAVDIQIPYWPPSGMAHRTDFEARPRASSFCRENITSHVTSRGLHEI